MTYEQELKANYRQVRARLFHHNPRPRMTIHKPPRRPRPAPKPKRPYSIGQARKLLELVSDTEHVDIPRMTSERRFKQICDARQIFYYLAHTYTRASLQQIGDIVGGKDHTTVLHGIRMVANRIRDNELWRFHLNQYATRLANYVDEIEQNETRLCASCPHRIKGEEAG